MGRLSGRGVLGGPLRGRAVLVSGASSGIGRACASGSARDGALVLAGVRREEDAAALAAEAPDRIVPVRLDVTDADAVREAVASVGRRAGEAGLAGLVNNAGVATAGPLEFLPVDALRAQLEVNVVGLLALTQACLPLLRRGRGRIVNVGSIAGRVATPLLGAYAASKFAVEGLSDALRRELAGTGVDVVLVEPGRIATPIWAKSVDAADRLLERMPAEATERYGPLLDRSRERALAGGGASADAVAEVVRRALVAPRPRTRYLVGRDARIGGALASWLPDRWLDAYLTRERSRGAA